MPGFDDGIKDAPANKQATPADFADSLAKYTARVEDLGTQIKAKEAELADIQRRIADAQAQLEVEATLKVEDLNGQIKDLQDQVDILTGTKITLDSEIMTRKQTRGSISLDFSTKQAEIDAAQAQIQKSTAEITAAQAQIDIDRKTLADASEHIDDERTQLDIYAKGVLSDLDKKTATVEALRAEAEARMSTAAGMLQQAQDDQAKVDQDRKTLGDQILGAQEILSGADSVRQQAEDAATELAQASAQALQNQKDIDQIRVMRVALNNQKQQLDAREQAVAQAEQKIGGN